MSAGKIDQMVDMLEFQEFDTLSHSTSCSAEFYSELLAAYLYKNDLINARFLWKRIPMELKSDSELLKILHKIYTCLWQNDFPGFFQAINFEWPANISEVMHELQEKTYKDTISLVGKAYTSLYEDALCQLLNKPPDVINELCNNIGWEVEAGEYPRLIKPTQAVTEKPCTETCEHLLANLADFVSFLEN